MADEATVVLLDAVIEGAAPIKLGPDAQEMIRREQIRELDAAQTEIGAAFDELGFLRAETARPELERLAGALKRGLAAANALWELAPDDGRPLEEVSR